MTFIYITGLIQDVSALFLKEAVALGWIMNLKKNVLQAFSFQSLFSIPLKGATYNLVVKQLKITGSETNKSKFVS